MSRFTHGWDCSDEYPNAQPTNRLAYELFIQSITQPMSAAAANPWSDLQTQIYALQQLYHCPPQRSALLEQSRTLVSTLSHLFQTQLLAQLESATFPNQARAYVTEMHRQIRLLSTDLSFFQAAQSEISQAQRFGQIVERLRQIRDYSDAIAQALEKTAETKA